MKLSLHYRFIIKLIFRQNSLTIELTSISCRQCYTTALVQYRSLFIVHINTNKWQEIYSSQTSENLCWSLWPRCATPQTKSNLMSPHQLGLLPRCVALALISSVPRSAGKHNTAHTIPLRNSAPIGPLHHVSYRNKVSPPFHELSNFTFGELPPDRSRSNKKRSFYRLHLAEFQHISLCTRVRK